jgi:hypothetical protein
MDTAVKRSASRMALSIDIRERYVDLAVGGPTKSVRTSKFAA